MSNLCIHEEEPYYDVLSTAASTTSQSQSPTPEEINKLRLWKCLDCGKWFSWIGDTIDAKNYI